MDLNGQQLSDDFVNLKIALPAIQPTGAETASVGTTYLRRHTQGVAIAGFSIESRIGRYQHTLHQGTILQSPEIFARGIGRSLNLLAPRESKSIGIPKALPERLGAIIHFLQ